MRIAATEIRGAATDVQDADAPDGLADEAEGLEEALRTLSDELVATRRHVRGRTRRRSRWRAGLSFEAWNTVQDRLADMREQGIAVDAARAPRGTRADDRRLRPRRARRPA